MDEQNKNNLNIPSLEGHRDLGSLTKLERANLLKAQVCTVDDVDRLTVEEVGIFKISGAAKKKLTFLKRKMSYIEAKRIVIRQTVINKLVQPPGKRSQPPKRRLPNTSSSTPKKRRRLFQAVHLAEKPKSEGQQSNNSIEKPQLEAVTQTDKSKENKRLEGTSQAVNPEEKLSSEGMCLIDKTEGKTKSGVTTFASKSKDTSKIFFHIPLTDSLEKRPSQAIRPEDRPYSYPSIRIEGIPYSSNLYRIGERSFRSGSDRLEERPNDLQIERPEERNCITSCERPFNSLTAWTAERRYTPSFFNPEGKSLSLQLSRPEDKSYDLTAHWTEKTYYSHAFRAMERLNSQQTDMPEERAYSPPAVRPEGRPFYKPPTIMHEERLHSPPIVRSEEMPHSLPTVRPEEKHLFIPPAIMHEERLHCPSIVRSDERPYSSSGVRPDEKHLFTTPAIMHEERLHWSPLVRSEERPHSSLTVRPKKRPCDSPQTSGPEKRPRSNSSQNVKTKKRLESTRRTRKSKPKVRARKQPLNESPDSVKVAIVSDGFPEAQLDREKHNLVIRAILMAYDNIPSMGIGNESVAFDKWISRPEYLLITCSNKYSAQWLKEIVPTLRPWENCLLKTLAANELPKPCVCTAYVAEEFGVKLSAEQILARLRIGNEGLNTGLWKVWGSSSVGNGQVWSFCVDNSSLKRLKELNMSPRCGFIRLKFRSKSSLWSENQGIQLNKLQDMEISD